jgi:hypothetical protein
MNMAGVKPGALVGVNVKGRQFPAEYGSRISFDRLRPGEER